MKKDFPMNNNKLKFQDFFPKDHEITMLVTICLTAGIIFNFFSMFIIFLLLCNMIIGMTVNLVYHKISFIWQQVRMKRITNYINLYEELLNNTYLLSNELVDTVIYLKNVSELTEEVEENRIQINNLEIEVFFLGILVSFETFLNSLYNIEKDTWFGLIFNTSLNPNAHSSLYT